MKIEGKPGWSFTFNAFPGTAGISRHHSIFTGESMQEAIPDHLRMYLETSGIVARFALALSSFVVMPSGPQVAAASETRVCLQIPNQAR